jgi:tetratricopeptide (TPR) repeat protein
MIFGLSWFIISMVPTLNIIPLVNEYSLILTAEHFLYFPIIGILLFVMGCSYFWPEHKGQKQRIFNSLVICSVIISYYLGMTIKQNTYWRGEIPLFERTLKFEKDFGRVHFLLAQAYANAGRFGDAVIEDHKALAIMQGYEQKVQNFKIKQFYLIFIRQIHYHLGYCLGVLGDLNGALEHHKAALDLDPDNEIYHFAVGNIYLIKGDMPGAIAHFEKIVEVNGDNLTAMNLLALCYQQIGEDAKAEKFLRIIVEKDSGSLSAKQNLENYLKRKNSL